MRSVHTSGTLFRASMRPFEYFEPSSIDEAMGLIRRFKEKASILAGGTSVLVHMKKAGTLPDALINIKKIKTLQFQPRIERGRLVLSPLTTLAEICESDVLLKRAPLLRAAAAQIASCQVRNRATLGGNLCTGSSLADMAPPLMVLDASVTVRALHRVQTLSVEEFFKSASAGAGGSQGIMVQIQLPLPDRKDFAVMRKHQYRTGMDLAIVSLAVRARLERRTLADIRIASGGTGPVPLRMREAERALNGTEGDDHSLRLAAEAAAAECSPVDDIRGSARYKSDMIKVHLIRVVKELLG